MLLLLEGGEEDGVGPSSSSFLSFSSSSLPQATAAAAAAAVVRHLLLLLLGSGGRGREGGREEVEGVQVLLQPVSVSQGQGLSIDSQSVRKYNSMSRDRHIEIRGDDHDSIPCYFIGCGGKDEGEGHHPPALREEGREGGRERGKIQMSRPSR